MPERWREGVISPIFKRGDRENVKNYRGITLLNTAYKIYAMILENRLSREIEQKKLIPETQAGFRRGRSTIDNIMILNYVVNREIKEKGGKLYTFFADLTAAFDKVNREKLSKILEEKGVSRRLRTRIDEIYEETRNRVKVNGEISEKFWTRRGVRQGCPLSPTLFSLYTADLEEKLRRGQTGGVVVGNEKFWSLAYADDIVLIAERAQDLKEMMGRMKKYLEGKELVLNAEKSKILMFKRGRSAKKKEEWKWGEEDIEEVKSFKYLGYNFQKNGGTETHVRETVKKAMMAMRQTWGIGERKFKNNFERRIKIFECLVKSIILYAAEVWGWAEAEKIERVQVKYIKWILGLDFNTPTYIVMEETKIDKVRVEARRRAVRYEERTRTNKINKIVQECWKEIDRNNQSKRSKWENERKSYYEKKGIDIEEIGIRCTEGQLAESLAQMDREEQWQEQYEKLIEGRYNRKYREIREETRADYLKREYGGRDQSLVARFRCGNEERANRFWRKTEENNCRICGKGEETIEHLINECEEMKEEEDLSRRSILKGQEQGRTWMRKIRVERKKRESSKS